MDQILITKIIDFLASVFLMLGFVMGINRKIFSPIKSELEKVYSPAEVVVKEGTPSVPEPVPKQTPEPTPEPEPIKITELSKVIEATPKAKPPVVSEAEPFIIHQETEPQPISEKKPISFPAIGWFKKAMPSGRQEKLQKTEAPVKVELEIFDATPASVETTAGKKEESEIVFDEVLLLQKGNKLEIGTPLVKDAKVIGKIIKQGKNKKVIIFKFKAKTRRHIKKGHRQPFTEVEITKIES